LIRFSESMKPRLFLNSYHVARYETLILRWNFRTGISLPLASTEDLMSSVPKTEGYCWRTSGAALGRVAMHAKRVRAGKAALSSPTRSQRDSPPLVGMRSSLVGTRARGEGEPHAQDAHVTDAAMVRLKCRT
jgi:hypothetical protein